MKTLTIGRDAGNQIVLNDKLVSRHHAQLTILDNGQVMIKDMGSSNGTFVNGNRIKETQLNIGDIVKCGTVFLNWGKYTNSNTMSDNSDQIHESVIPSYHENQNIISKMPLRVNTIRHERENTYLIIKIVVSSLFWIGLLFVLFYFEIFQYLTPIILLLSIISIMFIVIIIWLIGLFFKASIYGHSVKVNANQYPEIYRIAVSFSQRLGLQRTPDIFICNQHGLVNAMARRFLSKKYVLLYSSLVDLMLCNGRKEELGMILGHELGHHAAGHTNFWRNIFLKPSNVIPFLSAAYHRACELTADRIGFVLINNLKSAQNALLAIALGSERLAPTSNVNEFMQQEYDIPRVMGFINKIYSLHPRITKRVLEITTYSSRQFIQ